MDKFKSKPFLLAALSLMVTATINHAAEIRLDPVDTEAAKKPGNFAYGLITNLDLKKPDKPFKLSSFFNDEIGNAGWDIFGGPPHNLDLANARAEFAELGIYVNRFGKFTTDAPRTASEKAAYAGAKKSGLGRSVAHTLAAQEIVDDF